MKQAEEVDFSTKDHIEDLKGILKELHLAKIDKRDLEWTLESVTKNIRILEERAYVLMESDQIQSINIDGSTFFRKTDRYISAKDKEAVFQWLRDHGLEEIIKPTVHSGTLTAEIKRLEGEGEVIDPEIVNDNIVHRIGIRNK